MKEERGTFSKERETRVTDKGRGRGRRDNGRGIERMQDRGQGRGTREEGTREEGGERKAPVTQTGLPQQKKFLRKCWI
jgi:hypothetical protein